VNVSAVYCASEILSVGRSSSKKLAPDHCRINITQAEREYLRNSQ